MLISIIPNTTIAKRGIVTAKMRAKRTSIVNAIIIAPKTINGERINRRRNMFIPVCTEFMSPVILVIRVDVPSLSVSA